MDKKKTISKQDKKKDTDEMQNEFSLIQMTKYKQVLLHKRSPNVLGKNV